MGIGASEYEFGPSPGVDVERRLRIMESGDLLVLGGLQQQRNFEAIPRNTTKDRGHSKQKLGVN